jgi:putative flippase GtrA
MQSAGSIGSVFGRVQALRQNKEVERFLKFAVVGIIGAIIDYATYTILNRLGWFDSVTVPLPFGLMLTGLGISGTIALTLAVISNFIWNRYWTYPDSRSKPLMLQLLLFFAINVVGVFIRIPVIELLSKPFANIALSILPHLPQSTASWLGETGSWGLAVVIVMFWNFFVNRYLTYNDVK